MKLILVTGANGQLGNELRLLAASFPSFRFSFIDVQELDLCQTDDVSRYFNNLKPDYVINCAAYTAVDKAEGNEAVCRAVNRDAVENLARAARETGCRMLHVSTDYVFDGQGIEGEDRQLRPYREDDPTGPCSVYGKTKLEGEEILMSVCPDAVILRTAWLYSPFGNNFVKTMLRLGLNGSKLRVVADQWGSPTAAADLARALMQVVQASEEGRYVPGIFHFTDEGTCNWYQFTAEIHRQAGIVSDLTPVTTDQYPTAASRPAWSVLDKSKFKGTYRFDIPQWQDSLAKTLVRLQDYVESLKND